MPTDNDWMTTPPEDYEAPLLPEDEEGYDPRREAEEDEAGALYGDPRRCPHHGTIISSPDGMFDGVCGPCEAGEDEGEDEAITDGALSALAEADHDMASDDGDICF